MAQEAADLALGQRAAGVGVLVAREQVHAEAPHDTAVECPDGDECNGVRGAHQGPGQEYLASV